MTASAQHLLASTDSPVAYKVATPLNSNFWLYFGPFNLNVVTNGDGIVAELSSPNNMEGAHRWASYSWAESTSNEDETLEDIVNVKNPAFTKGVLQALSENEYVIGGYGEREASLVIDIAGRTLKVTAEDSCFTFELQDAQGEFLERAELFMDELFEDSPSRAMQSVLREGTLIEGASQTISSELTLQGARMELVPGPDGKVLHERTAPNGVQLHPVLKVKPVGASDDRIVVLNVDLLYEKEFGVFTYRGFQGLDLRMSVAMAGSTMPLSSLTVRG